MMAELNDHVCFEKKLTAGDLSEARLYVGRGAGQELMSDIDQAQEEVIVATPIVSPSYVDELLRKKEKGLKVTLITNRVENKRTEKALLDKLIGRVAVENPRRSARRRRDMKQVMKEIYVVIVRDILGVAALVGGMMMIVSILMSSSRYGLRLDSWITLIISIFVVLVGALVLFWEKDDLSQLRRKYRDIRRKSCADYQYTSDLDFVYNVNPHDFIHSKIYVIDRKTVYCGSMNFTGSGVTERIETMIRIPSPELAQELRSWLLSSYVDKQKVREER